MGHEQIDGQIAVKNEEKIPAQGIIGAPPGVKDRQDEKEGERKGKSSPFGLKFALIDPGIEKKKKPQGQEDELKGLGPGMKGREKEDGKE